MKIHPLSQILAVAIGAIGAIGFASCDSGTSNKDCDCAATPSSRFGVSDSLIGRWKGLAGSSGANDTFVIGKDSLVGDWSVASGGIVREVVKPYSDAVFYAHGGRMGVTNGQTTSDNVAFEYAFSGDTLWVELQGGIPLDNHVDRTNAFFAHGWLRRR